MTSSTSRASRRRCPSLWSSRRSTGCSQRSTRPALDWKSRRSRRSATPTWPRPASRAPASNPVVACAELALAMLDAVAEAGAPWQVRIGIHRGPVVAGVIGASKYVYDLWGDAVNTASRLETTASAGSIQVSEAVADMPGIFGRPHRRPGVRARGARRGRAQGQGFDPHIPPAAHGHLTPGRPMRRRGATRGPGPSLARDR